MPAALVLCVDVGSTFTKAVLVDVGTGVVLGTASHPTTVATDVMDGVDAVRARTRGGTASPTRSSSAPAPEEGCGSPSSATSGR